MISDATKITMYWAVIAASSLMAAVLVLVSK